MAAARNAGLVLALVGQQGAVVGVADRVQPTVPDAVDATSVVDVEPRPGVKPTVSMPMSSVIGALPVAKNTSSTSKSVSS